MKESLALITVVYKNYDVLRDLFISLESQTDKDFSLFIADTSEEKKPIKASLPSTVIPSENKGYAHGINLGIREAEKRGFRKFCVLNSDTVLDKDFVKKSAAAFLRHPGSVIGGKIYYAAGFEYHKNRYKKNDIGRVLWYAGGRVDWKNAVTEHLGVDQVDSGDFNQEAKTEFVTGCLMVFDQNVIDKIGFLDEDYFLYYEDSDYCERAKKNNIPLIYDPSIILWHKNAQSTDGSGSLLHRKYQKNSRLRFGLKYAPVKTKLYLLRNWVLNK